MRIREIQRKALRIANLVANTTEPMRVAKEIQLYRNKPAVRNIRMNLNTQRKSLTIALAKL